jgi:hypothetical protein
MLLSIHHRSIYLFQIQKLAEHRALREQQQKLLEKQLDEQRKNPPRLV